MKRLKSCLLASAGLAILAVTLSFTTPGRAIAQRVGEDCIRICNTASNPLHVIVQGITRVTGDVTINNRNAIATTVSGPVQVTTSPREPLVVIQRLKLDDIFREQVSLTLNPGETEISKHFVVPAGKYLEIKSASGTLVNKGSIGGLVNVNGSAAMVRVRVTRINNNVFDFPLFNQLVVISNAPGGAFSLFQVGGSQLGVFADTVDEVEVQLYRFSPYQIESKLELAISGEYHPV